MPYEYSPDTPSGTPITVAAVGRWRLLACGVAVTVLAAACGGRGASRPAAQPPARARVALAVEERTEAFVDATRPTDPGDAAPPSAVRALPTRIFFPGAGQPGRPYPLVVFAHGSGGLGADYDVLLRTWAAAGYVVAAPTFPFAASREATAAEAVIDYPNLPVDMSFVVDQTLRLNGDAGSALHGAVDPARVGAAGHSLGGMVTLARPATPAATTPG